MSHTPGPWEWWTSNSWRRLRYSSRGVSTDVLMPTVHRDGQVDIEATPADMALIAAAPDMLAALKAYAAWAHPVECSAPDLRLIRDQIRAAIAKAEGHAPKTAERAAK